MVCYNPILMYPVEGAITKNGKQHYSFYGSLASHPELAGDSRFIRCSCKQCIGCRLENSRQWAVRAVHEARSSSSAYFVTCTFDDYHLPRDKSLSKKFHQTFMKIFGVSMAVVFAFLAVVNMVNFMVAPIIITFCLILILMTKFFGSVQTVIILILLLVLPKYGNTVCILLVSLALILLPMSLAI